MAKSGLANFREWLLTAHGEQSPWGHEDTQPLVTVAESALERQPGTREGRREPATMAWLLSGHDGRTGRKDRIRGKS